MNFYVIFLEFSITHRVGTKRNDNFLFSLFPILFQPILAWNEFIMVFFNFFNFFLFFWYFLLRFGQERNGRIIFIFSISHPFTTCYGLKWIHNGIFLVLFSIFLNFLLRDGKERNGTERWFLFYLIHILFQHIFARNVAIFLVFYISNFLAIFLKFYITRWVGTKRNDNFYFFYFSSFSNLLWLEKKP